MDADAENGRCSDTESHVGECGEEVEGCIFLKGLFRVRSLGGGPRIVFLYFFLYVV